MAASSQQPGPSWLTATEPDTPFNVLSESNDDDLHAIGAEDEMPSGFKLKTYIQADTLIH